MDVQADTLCAEIQQDAILTHLRHKRLVCSPVYKSAAAEHTKVQSLACKASNFMCMRRKHLACKVLDLVDCPHISKLEKNIIMAFGRLPMHVCFNGMTKSNANSFRGDLVAEGTWSASRGVQAATTDVRIATEDRQSLAHGIEERCSLQSVICKKVASLAYRVRRDICLASAR